MLLFLSVGLNLSARSRVLSMKRVDPPILASQWKPRFPPERGFRFDGLPKSVNASAVGGSPRGQYADETSPGFIEITL
jgi:hypothetical protein